MRIFYVFCICQIRHARPSSTAECGFYPCTKKVALFIANETIVCSSKGEFPFVSPKLIFEN